jgi:glutamyl endopeptidase
MLHRRPSFAASMLVTLGLLSAHSAGAQAPGTRDSREVVHNVATGETIISPVPAAIAHWDAGLFPSPPGISAPQSIGPRGTATPVRELPSDLNPTRATAQSSDKARVQAVVPPDHTESIGDTTQYPWSAQCKLYITFPNGTKLERSGTLIHDKYVLTAGECAYDPRFGGWADTIEVVPGLNGGSAPFGSAYSTYMRTYSGWTDNQYLDDDFALLTLDDVIGDDAGWLGYEYLSSLNGSICNIAGYPSGTSQSFSYGHVWDQASTYIRVPTFSSYPGMVGACAYFYTQSDDQRRAVAIYVGDTYATRIDSEKFNSIKSWIDSGD